MKLRNNMRNLKNILLVLIFFYATSANATSNLSCMASSTIAIQALKKLKDTILSRAEINQNLKNQWMMVYGFEIKKMQSHYVFHAIKNTNTKQDDFNKEIQTARISQAKKLEVLPEYGINQIVDYHDDNVIKICNKLVKNQEEYKFVESKVNAGDAQYIDQLLPVLR